MAGFISNLKERWKVESAWQVILILLVFACTGFSVMFLKKPITGLIFSNPEETHTLFSVLYWVLIIPIYNVLLLFYGFVFGQFRFFWNFEKRFFRRLTGKGAKSKLSGSSGSAN